MKAVISKKFSLKEGPFIAGLERTLQELHVQRQAYHGATFVGNHVHKLLKVTVYNNSIVQNSGHMYTCACYTVREYSSPLPISCQSAEKNSGYLVTQAN